MSNKIDTDTISVVSSSVFGISYIHDNYPILILSALIALASSYIAYIKRIERGDKSHLSVFIAHAFMSISLAPIIVMGIHTLLIEYWHLNDILAGVISVIIGIYTMDIIKNIPAIINIGFKIMLLILKKKYK